MTVIDVHVIQRVGTAAVRNAIGLDSTEDDVEFGLIDLECIVVALELGRVVEIPRPRRRSSAGSRALTVARDERRPDR